MTKLSKELRSRADEIEYYAEGGENPSIIKLLRKAADQLDKNEQTISDQRWTISPDRMGS